MAIFWQFLKKKMAVFWQFFLHLNGNFPEGQLYIIGTRIICIALYEHVVKFVGAMRQEHAKNVNAICLCVC